MESPLKSVDIQLPFVVLVEWRGPELERIKMEPTLLNMVNNHKKHTSLSSVYDP